MSTDIMEPASRFLRLHSFEILIFIILGLLMGLCLAVAPLITNVTNVTKNKQNEDLGEDIIL